STGVRHERLHRRRGGPYLVDPLIGSNAHGVGKMKIAFIGLGNMGIGIAQCILKSGHDLIVWNRTATKRGPLVALGARAATTACEAAAAADVVVTSLMDDKSVLDVVRAGDGVLAGMRPDAVHACVTTISPECADDLESLHRAHGSFYVSAPVAGRPDAAASGRLATFLGGPANDSAVRHDGNRGLGTVTAEDSSSVFRVRNTNSIFCAVRNSRTSIFCAVRNSRTAHSLMTP